MTEFCTGKASDREDIIDFINMVFSQTGRPHNFKALLPKLYSDDSDTSACHFLAKEDGKIKAVVGLFPTELTAGGLRLKLGHIGSVSVHGYSRGKGYMKKLMAMALEAAAAGGYDALTLGGKKNRYQFFGFQPTEVVMKYIFVPENIRHQKLDTGSETITFEKVVSADSLYMDDIRALYEKRPAHMDRGDHVDFYKILSSWYNATYAVLKNGSFAGYINGGGMQADDGAPAYGGTQIFGEWGFKDISDFPKVIAAWFLQRKPSELIVCSPSYEREACELLGKYCENFGTVLGHSWHILNFGRIIEAFMKIKNGCEPLDDGKMTLAIEKYDGSIELCKLSVNSGKIQVCSETADADEYALYADRALHAAVNAVLDEKFAGIGLLDATEALFSEGGRYRDYGISGGLRFKNWFPLPLHIDDNDDC